MANFQSETVWGGNTNATQQVSLDFYYPGTKPSRFYKKKVVLHKTREEKFNETKLKFGKTYEREMGKPLTSDASGIVVVQLGQGFYSWEIEINPSTKNRCERMAIKNENKAMMCDYVFASRTYWLSNGRLEQLLDSAEALIYDGALAAVKKILKHLGDSKLKADYKGERLIDFGAGKHPYRIWEAKAEDKVILVNMLNGSIFILPVGDVPTSEEIKDGRFWHGNLVLIRNKSSKNSDYTLG